MTRTALDLFAGCGGLSLGLSEAGIQVVGAVESDAWAAETYQANHSAPLLQTDIAEITDREYRDRFSGVDMVVGGPPCQGFSVSGKRQFGIYNPKNQLVFEFIRAVKTLQPKIFILENVRGLASARDQRKQHVLEEVVKDLTSVGYSIAHRVLQAADFGIPQYRSRLFVIGYRGELAANPFPVITHSRVEGLGVARHLDVLFAISDLPPLKAGEGDESRQEYLLEPQNRFQEMMRAGSRGVFNHVAMRHTDRIVQRFKSIPPGGKSYAIGRTAGGMDTVTVYKSNNQRLVRSLPSLCITANFQSTYVHPLLNRNLTAREAARIQTFPDWFHFNGKRTLMSSTLLRAEGRHAENFLSQYNQIGNAVPPMLARQFGEAMLRSLDQGTSSESELRDAG